jgi:three-Cys-motif partner protein
MTNMDLDVVGYWTEIKLHIIRDYAREYAKILNKQKFIRHFAFIDGFAGAGKHISKTTGDKIDGSPAVVLGIQPPFSHYHFIDLNGNRTEMLRQMATGRKDVTIYQGDCNKVLLEEVFPQCCWGDYRRALCLLDPYKLDPNWEVVKTAGEMGSIEIFINFMIMDAKLNVLLNEPEKAQLSQIKRMNAFWGDDSWRRTSYKKQRGLFGEIEEKVSDQEIAQAYQKRLKEVARFKYVPAPIPMCNSKGVVVYYLLFASNNPTGEKIVKSIFHKYQKGKRYGY